MNEEEVERLLRAMPLKKPSKMPATLFARAKPKRRLVRRLRAAISFRIPLWQAVLGLVVAMVIYAGVSNLFLGPQEKPTQTEQVQVREVAVRPEPSATSPPGTIRTFEEGFWRLPERYMEMIAVAQKQRPDSAKLERSEL